MPFIFFITMESETVQTIKITAKDIIKKFKPKFNFPGEIIAFNTPSKQNPSKISERILIIKIRKHEKDDNSAEPKQKKNKKKDA